MSPPKRVEREQIPTASDVVVETLRAHDVDIVFAVPGGGTNLDLIESARRAGIGCMRVHSETAAIFMASTYGEMTGLSHWNRGMPELIRATGLWPIELAR